MLTINYKRDDITLTKEWHIGDKSPIPMRGIHMITDIHADGHELDHIQSKFYCATNKIVTIPLANTRVMSWYGDIAKTIVANL